MGDGMDIIEIEDKAKTNSGNFVQFARSKSPRLSVLPTEVNEDLAKIKYIDNKNVYFDIEEFTYSIVKQGENYNFFVKHNAPISKKIIKKNTVLPKIFKDADMQNKKYDWRDIVEKNLPYIVVVLIILSLLIVVPVALKLL